LIFLNKIKYIWGSSPKRCFALCCAWQITTRFHCLISLGIKHPRFLDQDKPIRDSKSNVIQPASPYQRNLDSILDFRWSIKIALFSRMANWTQTQSNQFQLQLQENKHFALELDLCV